MSSGKSAPPPTRDARGVVLDLLLARGDFPTRRFPAVVAQLGLSDRDRALARTLLGGVLRRRRTLDALFKGYSNRRQVDTMVLWTLRLATYQRFFLHGIPTYAAFDSTLEAVKARLGRRLGFANAVLRAMERGVQEIDPAEATQSVRDLIVEGKAYRFDREVFPDPEAAPIEHLGVRHSYPDELVRRWQAETGAEATLKRLQASNAGPSLGIRVNPMRSDAEAVLEAWRSAGIEASATELSHALRLTEPAGDVRQLPGFREGHWSVQDLFAQRAVALAEVEAGEQVLDLCAAPGGKSFAVYEATGGQARVMACDVSEKRLRRMTSDQARLGHAIEIRRLAAGEIPAPPQGGDWDLILLDVPCTNTGVLARRAEARWNFNEEKLRSCIRTQKQILDAVVQQGLGPKTRVLWATCSLEPEENQRQVQRLEGRSGLHLQLGRQFEPDDHQSGGFAALLTR